MALPTTTITHDNDEYTISYEQHLECGSCRHSWESTHVDHSPIVCPACGANSDHTLTYKTYYYTKTRAIPIAKEDLELDADMHAAALRQLADEFEALVANGWELVESDTVHIYFAKTIDTSTTSP